MAATRWELDVESAAMELVRMVGKLPQPGSIGFWFCRDGVGACKTRGQGCGSIDENERCEKPECVLPN
jgi:hypothetical protein